MTKLLFRRLERVYQMLSMLDLALLCPFLDLRTEP